MHKIGFHKTKLSRDFLSGKQVSVPHLPLLPNLVHPENTIDFTLPFSFLEPSSSSCKSTEAERGQSEKCKIAVADNNNSDVKNCKKYCSSSSSKSPAESSEKNVNRENDVNSIDNESSGAKRLLRACDGSKASSAGESSTLRAETSKGKKRCKKWRKTTKPEIAMQSEITDGIGSPYDVVERWLNLHAESSDSDEEQTILYSVQEALNEQERSEHIDEAADSCKQFAKGMARNLCNGCGQSRTESEAGSTVEQRKKQGKESDDAESVMSSVTMESSCSWLKSNQRRGKRKPRAKTKSSHTKDRCIFYDDKENSVDSYDSYVVSNQEGPQVERKPPRTKRASANLDFTTGSPRKKPYIVSDFDVPFSSISDGKKRLQQKKQQTKLKFMAVAKKKIAVATEDTDRLASKQIEDYQSYIEEQDRLLAMQLQADFDFEAKYGLNTLRKQGSKEEYHLRRNRADCVSVGGGTANTRTRRK